LSAAAEDLAGRSYTTGVYKWGGALTLSTTVTFDGSPTDVFIMITSEAFTTAVSSKVLFVNGAKAENVFWVVGAAVSTGASSEMHGIIINEAAVTLGAGSKMTGAVLTTGVVSIGANAVVVKSISAEDGQEDNKNRPVVEILEQDVSTVTVRLNQEWTTSSRGDESSLAIFYEYKESNFTNKCHTANDVTGNSLFDTITITCNDFSPVAHLHICVADNNGNDILSLTDGDDATLPKCCQSEAIVPPNTPTVCYMLEISCDVGYCIDTDTTTVEKSRRTLRLRGSSY